MLLNGDCGMKNYSRRLFLQLAGSLPITAQRSLWAMTDQKESASREEGVPGKTDPRADEALGKACVFAYYPSLRKLAVKLDLPRRCNQMLGSVTVSQQLRFAITTGSQTWSISRWSYRRARENRCWICPLWRTGHTSCEWHWERAARLQQSSSNTRIFPGLGIN